MYLNIQINLIKKQMERNNSIHIFFCFFLRAKTIICGEGGFYARVDLLIQSEKKKIQTKDD